MTVILTIYRRRYSCC